MDETVSKLVEKMLDTLAEFRSEKDAISLKKNELIDTVLTPEIKARIAEIEAEFAGKEDTVSKKIDDLTTEIKNGTLGLGASVKATLLHAVWAKGRISWDTKAMDGYAVDHPEILFMRKEGDPSVSIRTV